MFNYLTLQSCFSRKVIVTSHQKGLQSNYIYCSATFVKRPLSKRPNMVFKTDFRLMQVKSIAECFQMSILQYFRPLLSYQLSLRPFVLSIFKWPFYTGLTVRSLDREAKMSQLCCSHIT